jgi:hypothetical protein
MASDRRCHVENGHIIVTDLLWALLGSGLGGCILAHAPCNSTMQVFPSCLDMYHAYTMHAQVTSHNRVQGSHDITQWYDEMFIACC